MTKRITLTESDSSSQTVSELMTRKNDSNFAKTFDTLSASDLWRMLTQRRKLIATLTCAVTLLVAAILFIIPNQYQSEASLLPSGAQDKMADLKRLAGFGSLSATDENSSELFPEILRSRTIQDSVLAKRYNFNDDARPMTLKLDQYFDQQNPDKLRDKLNSITYVSLDKKTGVIDIGVETEYPELSKAVLVAYLAQLESFNLYARRSAAKDNANYLGKQIEQTRHEMAASEDSLESYQASNRNWLEGSSPDLLKTLARLQREVEIQNKKYLYLTQEFEIAKLDAQKDVPIMRVLDNPSLPVEKTSPKRGLLLAATFLLTFLTASFGVVAVEIRRNSASVSSHPTLYMPTEQREPLHSHRVRGSVRMKKVTESEEVKV